MNHVTASAVTENALIQSTTNKIVLYMPQDPGARTGRARPGWASRQSKPACSILGKEAPPSSGRGFRRYDIGVPCESRVASAGKLFVKANSSPRWLAASRAANQSSHARSLGHDLVAAVDGAFDRWHGTGGYLFFASATVRLQLTLAAELAAHHFAMCEYAQNVKRRDQVRRILNRKTAF